MENVDVIVFIPSVAYGDSSPQGELPEGQERVAWAIQ